ncbi:unnamed protein product [Camellia sinensis]
MHLSENEGIEGQTFVVAGGLGFVGSSLCLELLRRGAHQVRTFDLCTTSPCSHHLLSKGVHCIPGDVTRKQDVQKALHGADCVFHRASYGMSGKEMLQFGRVDDVNINGTCHVLEACVVHGVKRLVYVSTYNVVFGGKEIINGNETLPYFPLNDYVDPYSRSKCIAEQLVLKSNGRPLKKKNGNLYTCAIRPAAISGPGEERHLPRIINLSKLGLLPFKIGKERVKSDWVYIDNLVLALILASIGLLDDIPQREGRPIAAGQPYFISDGSPVGVTHYFSFLKAKEELGVDTPFLTVLKTWTSPFEHSVIIHVCVRLEFPEVSARAPCLRISEPDRLVSGFTPNTCVLPLRGRVGFVDHPHPPPAVARGHRLVFAATGNVYCRPALFVAGQHFLVPAGTLFGQDGIFGQPTTVHLLLQIF